MQNMDYFAELVRKGDNMQSFDRLVAISYHAMQCAVLPGDNVEFGCFEGYTAALITAVAPAKRMHVYDSFLGLPAKAPEDEGCDPKFFSGALAVPLESVLRVFNARDLPAPLIHRGFFSDLTEFQLPSQIAFAHIDADFYTGTLEALNWAWPRLVKGGVILIDDYCNEELPGVTKAVQKFFEGNVVRLNGINGPLNQGYVTKPTLNSESAFPLAAMAFALGT